MLAAILLPRCPFMTLSLANVLPQPRFSPSGIKKHLRINRVGINSVGRALDYRAQDHRFDSRGRNNTQGLNISAEK